MQQTAEARTALLARAGLAAAAGGALAAMMPTLIPVDEPLPDEPIVLRPAGATTAMPTIGEPRMLATLNPVTDDGSDLPPEFQVADLVKAAGLADEARAEERARLAREAAVDCPADLDGLGAVKPWVRDAARYLSCQYDEPTLIGVASRGSGVSDHPRGLAVDLMTDRARGDRIADCALANRDELGVDYVIWRQRVDQGDGWEPMEDRGSATANHYDHVHISFRNATPDSDPLAARCD